MILKRMLGKIPLRQNVFYFSAGLILIGMFGVYYPKYRAAKNQMLASNRQIEHLSECKQFNNNYRVIGTILKELKKQYYDVDFKDEDAKLKTLNKDIVKCDLAKVRQDINWLQNKMGEKTLEAKKKGEVSGKVTANGTPVAVGIDIFSGANKTTTVQSQADGNYKYRLLPGKYSLKVTSGSYNAFSKDIDIVADQTNNQDIALTYKPAAPRQPRPVATRAAAPPSVGGLYNRVTVATSRGSFSVHLLTAPTSQYSMKVDTAADGDCVTNCPVKSLSEYVSRNGAVAGINGTYFCPASYGASCASTINGFYYKVYNSRLQLRINWSNGLGDYLPFLMINKGGGAQYFGSWSSARNSEMNAGISCRPHLVSGGQIVLQDSDLDSDKERYTKSNRGFLGLKGQTIYAGIVLSANIPDSAAVAQALGLDYAMNIDGGGSSALYYGGYKAGPGRALPNAVVFVPR